MQLKIFSKAVQVDFLALDPFAEHQIFDFNCDFLKNRTVIIISHKLSIIKNVDSIYFFDKGTIIESGKHEELMRLDGFYAHMYRKQRNNYY